MLMIGTARRGLIFSCATLLLGAATAFAADWPHWLGPNGDGSSPEHGLLTTWPAGGPNVLWKVVGGDGYSSVAVAGGRAITLVQRDGAELVLALDAASGKELWTARVGPAYKNQYGNGPRSTPSIDGQRVYVTSVTGPVLCLKAASGKEVWRRDLLQEFGAKNLTWGLAASPVVEGNLLLVVPGAKGAGVAALDKRDGKLVWKTGNDKAAYASPVPVTVGGQRQVLFFTAPGLLAVAADSGRELWRVPWQTEFDCNICTPLPIGDRVFVSSGEDVGCALFRLSGQGAPEVVWESKGKKSVMKNYWANTVAHEGYLYGLAGEFSKVIDLRCLELATGKVMWSKTNFGKGAITLADGHLFITTKPGDLVLVRATPEGYQEKARVKVLGENRTVPTIAGGRLYLRDRESIRCLNIAGQ
jgi:outer membrane protein assembly factor BamB